MADAIVVAVDDLRVSPTAALFEGGVRTGAGVTIFVVRTPPGRHVDLHTHPYAETFVLLEGRGRWTAGEDVVEVAAEQVITVPADTPHGFRNVGSEPLLVVSVHESPRLVQVEVGAPPA